MPFVLFCCVFSVLIQIIGRITNVSTSAAPILKKLWCWNSTKTFVMVYPLNFTGFLNIINKYANTEWPEEEFWCRPGPWQRFELHSVPPIVLNLMPGVVKAVQKTNQLSWFQVSASSFLQTRSYRNSNSFIQVVKLLIDNIVHMFFLSFGKHQCTWEKKKEKSGLEWIQTIKRTVDLHLMSNEVRAGYWCAWGPETVQFLASSWSQSRVRDGRENKKCGGNFK